MFKYIRKPWGHEEWLYADESFGLKRIYISDKQLTSYHYHTRKDEVVYVDTGEIQLRLENGTRRLVAGQGIRIKPRTKHQIEAVLDTILVEISNGFLDDVVRLEDPHKDIRAECELWEQPKSG